jgi:membrane-associated phospholipid phosphatase
VIAFIVLGLRALLERCLTQIETLALRCALSLASASAIKNQLKIVFGRTWPETWVCNNPSLIRDGVYGFNPLQTGAAFESFPSGHTSAIVAVTSVLWICYPRLRLLYALLIVAVVVGLIGANIHFLSDCIAGAFLGASTGWIWSCCGRAAGDCGPSAPTIRDNRHEVQQL